uniref:F-box domain-containing protein n=1 Tax=Rhizochromulina marina TaxID=1034831 RepID=A0A7S2W0S9_9STRA|mmetsp:Transcript_10847/g.31052  ORF Transcript_10847/g.31052 Transcript_10847/m.31052 type:complete len:492 (+) Transcript_10847:104-1579(+)
MAVSLDDVPELAIEKIMSYLAWPHAVSALVLSHRFHENAWARSSLWPVLQEQRAAVLLGSPQSYRRSRADLPRTAKSTIALAFSSDRKTLASTHGDHTVKIVDVVSSTVQATLEGHPRTPWTVKFHPFKPNIVASGCLGGQLRVWDTTNPNGLHHVNLPHPVISLSFHPDGTRLAAAAGTQLFIWEYSKGNLGLKIMLQTKVSLRCVRFLDQNRLLVGIRSRTPHDVGLTSYIRAARAQLHLFCYDQARIDSGAGLTDPVMIVKHALLYNDAGLDVTSDCRSVLTCAEFLSKPTMPPLSPCTPETFSASGELAVEPEEARQLPRVAHLIQVSLVPTTHAHPGSAAMQVDMDSEDWVQGEQGAQDEPRWQRGCGEIIRQTCLEGLWGASQGGTFVTSVKLSPTGEFVLLGCSRGNSENAEDGEGLASPNDQHPVAAVWRLGDMARMETLTSMASDEDDANVALFHPRPGAGVVYGTKQGHIACALAAAPYPW